MRVLPGTLGSLAAVAAVSTLSTVAYGIEAQNADAVMGPLAGALVFQLYVYPAGAITLVLTFFALGTALLPNRPHSPAGTTVATPKASAGKPLMATLARWTHRAGLAIALGGGTLMAILATVPVLPWHGPVVFLALRMFATAIPPLLLGSALFLAGAVLAAIARRGHPPAPPLAPAPRREPVPPAHRA